MNDRRLADLASPESIAAMLVGLMAVVVMATQVVANSPSGDLARATASADASPSSAPTMAPNIRLALETVLAVNRRLADREKELRTAASAKTPSARDIAEVLQAINAEIIIGKQAVEGLLSAPETAALGRDVGAYYDRIAELNGETLGTTIRNVRVYVVGATAALDLLAGLSPLSLRVTAALAGAHVAAATPTPPLTTIPSPTPSPRVTVAPASPSPSGSTAASGSPRPAGGGLVSNGGFEDGLTDWQLLLVPPANAMAAVRPAEGIDQSAAAEVDVLVGSDARPGISLVHGGLTLRSGSTYIVELEARASADREVRVRLTGLAGQTYTARVFPIGTTWTRISFTQTQLLGDDAAELALDMGRWDATVWFDNVSVHEQTR